MLTVANLVIIGKMASRSCYREIGGFSKWCLKLVWVWPFLSNRSCFGVACYLRNVVHCQCMPYPDRYNYILTTDVVRNANACTLGCIFQAPATIMSKTIVFWSGTNLFLLSFVLLRWCARTLLWIFLIQNDICGTMCEFKCLFFVWNYSY